MRCWGIPSREETHSQAIVQGRWRYCCWRGGAGRWVKAHVKMGQGLGAAGK